MSTRTVHINVLSLEVVLEGCLIKAPPLNGRGRKKWHERYFILRANRTFECYRSKKAADSKKGPRRTIDLRECINLEVGLAYKNYKYVICLGTFKRIFFFAAPSEPMMLQWADVLEKVKNSTDGDCIEVLDIGLRKVRGVPVVSSLSLSVSRAFSTNKHNKSSTLGQRTKSAMALSHFSRISTDTLDLRMADKSPPKDSSLFTPATPNSNLSLRSSEDESLSGDDQRGGFPSISSDCSSSYQSSIATSGSMTLSPSQGHTSSDDCSIAAHMSTGQNRSNTIGSRTHSSAVIPSKVPPPRGLALNFVSRNKDGYFISNCKKKGDQVSHTNSVLSSTEDESADVNRLEVFTPNDGCLNRPLMTKKPNLKMKDMSLSLKDDQVAVDHISETKDEMIRQSNNENRTFLKTNFMKRSVRYRKIKLREPENPLHVNKNESDSEDGEIDSPSSSSYLVPGPDASLNCAAVLADTSYENETGELKNESRPKSVDGSINLSSSCPDSVFSLHSSHHPIRKLLSPSQHSQANSYSRVIIMGTRDGSLKEDIRPTQSKCKPTKLFLKKKPSLDEQEENEELTEMDETDQCSRFPRKDEATSPSLFVEPELLLSPSVIPAPSNEVFTNLSPSSLDDILVEPPEMFGTGMKQVILSPITGFDSDSPYLKRKISQIKNVSGAVNKDSKPTDKMATILDLAKNYSIPDQQPKISAAIPDLSIDRNSTESYDTGYTSSTSPGYQSQVSSKHMQSQQQQQKFQRQQCNQDFNAGVAQDGRSTPIPEEELRSTDVEGILKSYSSHHSQGSTSSDVARFYIPFVFHSKEVAVEDSANVRKDPNKFCIQVCLVENSEELIKNLVLLKRLEGFSLVEAEEVGEGEGSLITSQMDDFTVETSLEDLEFGFSVTSSTQKDIFMRKVRQFTFEVKNLFGTSKLFSCDVEICYADQRTVLSIEVR